MCLLSKRFLMLQSGYFIFSLAGIFLKSSASYSVLSLEFLLRYAGSLVCVFFFAILWQQVLRDYDLVTAYSWRGIIFLWTFIWAVIFFGEKVSLNNAIGSVVILIGVFLVNRHE